MPTASGPIEMRLSNFPSRPLPDKLVPATLPSEDKTPSVPQEAVAEKLTSPQKSETKSETLLSVKPKTSSSMEADVPVEKEQKEEPLAISSTVEKRDEEPPAEVLEKTNQGETVLQAEQKTTSPPDTQSAINSSNQPSRQSSLHKPVCLSLPIRFT